jgi:hydroxymethylbilane synthase
VKRVVLGTRGSALALAQVELARAALAQAWPEVEVEKREFVTRGDKKLDLDLMREPTGGKGLFTKELEDALLAGTIDVAVHSLKDLPGHNPRGLEVAAVLERAPTADVLITKGPASLEALPSGARVGTSSVRRARQLRWLRSDLAIEQWRGNVGTRLRKLAERDDVAGIVLAQAGLERLGIDFADGSFTVVSLHGKLLPAIGQGAIALQARTDRPEVCAVLAAINHAPTFTCIRAERALQQLLKGDCALPVGVRTQLDGDRLEMSVILFGDEGTPPAQATFTGPVDNPQLVAREVFGRLKETS